MMIMNNDSYAKLSPKAKAVIDANSGDFYTNWFNKVIDDTEHDNQRCCRTHAQSANMRSN